MKNLMRVIVFFSLCFAAQPALALDLHDARKQALVGEGADGYAVVLSGGGEVKSLVDDVNAKRRKEYARIAKEQGQTVDVVGKVAAGQIVGNLEAGSKYMGSDGKWQTR